MSAGPEHRIRVVAIEVHLQLADDDGEYLHNIPIQPIPVAPSEWDRFDLETVLAEVAERIGPTRRTPS